MDGKSPPKGPLESLCILRACPGVLYLDNTSILILFPGGLQSLLAALAHRLEGASRSLGRGQGCLSCTWQKDREARVSGQKKPSQIGQLFKTVCPTCRTHSDSRQFPGVNRPRNRAKSKQTKGLGPEYAPKQTRSNTALPVGSLTSSPKL